MRPEPNDADAIRASLDDPHAFTAVFDRHYDAVSGFLRRRVGSAVADELAAEVFVRAFESRARYALERAYARPWLLGIAVNLLRHHYRSEEPKLRAYARSGIDPLTQTGPEVEARLDATAQAPRVAAALSELRREERDVLLLHAWGDLDHAEIAEALGIPVGTVRSRLSRARANVRELVVSSRTREPEDTAVSEVKHG